MNLIAPSSRDHEVNLMIGGFWGANLMIVGG